MTTITDTAEKSLVRLNTKGFCIFCLKRGDKPVDKSVDSANNDDNENTIEQKINIEKIEAEAKLRHQFFKVICRYLKTNFTNLSNLQNDDNEDSEWFLNKKFQVLPEVDFGFMCSDCSIMVEGICQLFHELKKLEIQLDWKARQLKNIMAFAKRAPTRVKIFREQFNDSGNPNDMEELGRIEMFRKELLDKCSSKFRKIQPRIVFKRRGDPLSKHSRKRRNEKKIRRNVTLHDVEIQTESTEISSLDIEKEKEGHSDNQNIDVSSPAPPSPAYSSEVIPDPEQSTGDSACFIRIRNVESLASPTKSVSEESPVRQTRSSSRRLLMMNSEEESPEEARKESRSRNTSSSTKHPEATILKSVPDLVASLSTPSSSNMALNIVDMRSKKATLTEWLQSTFNCDKCNKMFISETTLNVHKTTCGVEESRLSETQEKDSYEQDDDAGESPMDIDLVSNGNGSSEEDDPLGEITEIPTSSGGAENSTGEKAATNTCTIRILKQAPTKSTSISGSRFCKYCQTHITVNHFGRHRETIKHKFNKRTYKKAKKAKSELAAETENAGSSDTSAGAVEVQPVNVTCNTTTPASSTAVVTVTRDENNVKVVKIIYVAKNASTEDDGQTKNNQELVAGNTVNNSSANPINVDASNATDIIDISED